MKKSILIVSSECYPYQKIGGLGDANADYAKAYKSVFPEDDLSVILPLYNIRKPTNNIILNGYTLVKTDIKYKYSYGVHNSEAIIYKVQNPLNNIPVIFIYSSEFSNNPKPYSGNIFKNSCAFSFAVLEYLKNIRILNPPLIIQTTDFPIFTKRLNKEIGQKVKTIHIIHNGGIAYQSLAEPFEAILSLGTEYLLKDIFNNKDIKHKCLKIYKKYNKEIFPNNLKILKFLSNYYNIIIQNKENCEIIDYLNNYIKKYFIDYLTDNGFYNPIKQHILESDFWITDSPTYYKELLTEKKYSFDLHDILKQSQHKGTPVLAGIDPERYNPKTSINVYKNFDNQNFMSVRNLNKKYIINNLSKENIINKNYDKCLFPNDKIKLCGGFDDKLDDILIFMSCRADVYQKGIDIAFYSIYEILNCYNVKFIFNAPNSFENKYITDFITNLTSNSEYDGKYIFIDSFLPNEFYCAGSDLFLMPSRFEPCGFSQLIAMRFGCIPVVYRTGGLNDTIIDYNENPEKGNGFKTDKSFFETNSVIDYVQTLKRAISEIQKTNVQNIIIKNAMDYDCSWNNDKITNYNNIYKILFTM